MWWERWIPKSYLTKNVIIGVECLFNETGVIFNYVILQSKKCSVQISEQGTTSDVKEIIRLAKKWSSPITLTVCGTGVIFKKIIFSENDSLELKDLLNQYFSALPSNEFFIQFFKNEINSGHIAVCRKEQINQLISQFSLEKTEIVNIHIGPLICNAISTLSSEYNNIDTSIYTLDLEVGFIEKITPKVNPEIIDLEMGGIKINTNTLIAFASGFDYLSHQNTYQSENEEIINLPKLHVEKNKIRFLLFTIITTLFLICGVNSVLFFQKFEENNALEGELNLYQYKNNQITELLESYQKKKSLIEQAGIFDNKKMAVYADKIASTLPEEIILRELNFNPEKGDTEADSLMDFNENLLIIKGNCNKSLLLNDWINILKSQNFIKTVNLETFTYNSEGYLPNFILKVDIK
jgi:Tfp pilus assembly protein PilN